MYPSLNSASQWCILALRVGQPEASYLPALSDSSQSALKVSSHDQALSASQVCTWCQQMSRALHFAGADIVSLDVKEYYHGPPRQVRLMLLTSRATCLPPVCPCRIRGTQIQSPSVSLSRMPSALIMVLSHKALCTENVRHPKGLL